VLVGVRRDQARIDGKAFRADQSLRQTALHHRLEHMPQHIALPEPPDIPSLLNSYQCDD
jgi:hypothetical protein